jgi:hypothetical protein
VKLLPVPTAVGSDEQIPQADSPTVLSVNEVDLA